MSQTAATALAQIDHYITGASSQSFHSAEVNTKYVYQFQTNYMLMYACIRTCPK